MNPKNLNYIYFVKLKLTKIYKQIQKQKLYLKTLICQYDCVSIINGLKSWQKQEKCAKFKKNTYIYLKKLYN